MAALDFVAVSRLEQLDKVCGLCRSVSLDSQAHITGDDSGSLCPGTLEGFHDLLSTA